MRKIFIYKLRYKSAFLKLWSRPQMESQSEMLESQKFNSDTLHQDLICLAAKNKPSH